MSEIIYHSYPESNLLDQNKYRCIKILVKEQTTLAGGAAELKVNLDKAWNEVKEAYNNVAPVQYEADVEKTTIKSKKLQKTKTVYGCALPLPDSLEDSQSHNWTTSQSMVSNGADMLLGGKVMSILGDAQAELASVTGARKFLIDPGYWQDYKGTEPRNFSMNWDLIPNSATEAKHIILILRNLKKFTLPTTVLSGVAIRSPYLFDIEIGNPVISGIVNMNNVVCKSMNISYSGASGLQFFTDGTPKHITLQMEFAERSLVTSEFY